jgi:SAM-dependent methyltransferase
MNMNDRILYQSCPLCVSTSFQFHKEGNCSQHPLYSPVLSPIIRWNRCLDCGHVFAEGYYTPEAQKLVLARTVQNQVTGTDLENARFISARMVDRMLPYVSEGRWLDIGFGSGSLLFTAMEYGFTPIGSDLRFENVELLKRMGIEAYSKEIHELELQAKCAVVSMADVLEHVPYPKAALAKVHDLLEDGGMLMISMPNMDSAIWRALDQKQLNPYWGELEHLHNFGRARLYALLSACGFEPKSYGVSMRYRVCMEVIAQKV